MCLSARSVLLIGYETHGLSDIHVRQFIGIYNNKCSYEDLHFFVFCRLAFKAATKSLAPSFSFTTGLAYVFPFDFASTSFFNSFVYESEYLLISKCLLERLTKSSLVIILPYYLSLFSGHLRTPRFHLRVDNVICALRYLFDKL